ncbi:aldo/keto reductase, partial [Staphylococcus hominis]
MTLGLISAKLNKSTNLSPSKVKQIDLLLLHQQVGNYRKAWIALENAVKEGKVKSIGISNFDGERLVD